jgi:hypothetical protein
MNCSNHAIYKFRKITNTKKSNAVIHDKITTMFQQAERIVLNKNRREWYFIEYNGRPSKYYRYGGFLFVVTDNTIVTLYQAKTKRKFKPSYMLY